MNGLLSSNEELYEMAISAAEYASKMGAVLDDCTVALTNDLYYFADIIYTGMELSNEEE